VRIYFLPSTFFILARFSSVQRGIPSAHKTNLLQPQLCVELAKRSTHFRKVNLPIGVNQINALKPD